MQLFFINTNLVDFVDSYGPFALTKSFQYFLGGEEHSLALNTEYSLYFKTTIPSAIYSLKPLTDMLC